MAHKKTIVLPLSGVKYAVCTLLSKEGYLSRVEKIQNGNHMSIRAELTYKGKDPVVIGLKRISKPGLRLYVSKQQIPVVMGGMGIAVISTPQGVMSGKEAKKKGIGGELLCEVW